MVSCIILGLHSISQHHGSPLEILESIKATGEFLLSRSTNGRRDLLYGAVDSQHTREVSRGAENATGHMGSVTAHRWFLLRCCKSIDVPLRDLDTHENYLPLKFSKPIVLETYTAFVNNWNKAKDAIRTTKSNKPAFAKFLEAMAREHKGKLSLDNLLIKIIQKFPKWVWANSEIFNLTLLRFSLLAMN